MSVDLTIFASFPQLNFDLDRGVFPVVIQAVVDEGDGEHCWSFLIFIFKYVGPVRRKWLPSPRVINTSSSGNRVSAIAHIQAHSCATTWEVESEMRARTGVDSRLCQCCREREKVTSMTSHWSPPLISLFSCGSDWPRSCALGCL